jgi:hypothetical protein
MRGILEVLMNRRGCLKFGVAGILWASGALAQAPGPRIALKGYDPVAYFVDGKPTLGRAEFEYPFDDARYRFASARHLDQFKADPDRYLPQFGGSCTMMVSRGEKIEAEPENWLIVDGRLYLFTGLAGPDRLRANPQEILARARANWLAMK